MKLAFVSDLHGNAQVLNKLIECYQNTDYQLVLLGDYTDGRGSMVDNLAMVQTLLNFSHRKIAFRNQPILLLGNHDNFIRMAGMFDTNGSNNAWLANGGKRTLRQLGYRGGSIKRFLQENYTDYLKLLDTMLMDYEVDGVYAVHAGLDMSLSDPIHDTDNFNKLWIRDRYLTVPNQTNKTIVTGHTPTDNHKILLLNPHEEHKRYLIDGGINSSEAVTKAFNVLEIDTGNGSVVEKSIKI